MRRLISPILVAAALACLALWPLSAVSLPPADDPYSRAEPLDIEGAPNLFKVSHSLYRSAQPTALGMRNLKKYGVVTVINLRSFNSDRDEIGDTGLAYEHIYMKAWHPERKEAVRFLQIATDPKRIPVLVHCHYGADRTGTMVALYRIAVQDWPKKKAIEEMTSESFGYHPIWGNLPQWIHELDIEALRKDAGIENVDVRKGASEQPGVAPQAGSEKAEAPVSRQP